MRGLTAETFPAHFWGKVKRVESGCMEWQAGLNRLGYGQVSFLGKMMSAHRAAWIIKNGPIPNGLHVLHSCDNRPCVNPEHLWLGTHQDNMRDMVAKGRQTGARRKSPEERDAIRAVHISRPFCKHGHPNTPNTFSPTGACKVCLYTSGAIKRGAHPDKSREEIEHFYLHRLLARIPKRVPGDKRLPAINPRGPKADYIPKPKKVLGGKRGRKRMDAEEKTISTSFACTKPQLAELKKGAAAAGKRFAPYILECLIKLGVVTERPALVSSK